MTSVQAPFAHVDGTLPAIDGQTIAFRTTETVGKPKAINVSLQGTLGTADMFDQMGEILAHDKGIKSVAISSRTGIEWTKKNGTPELGRYADDLQRVVDTLRAQYPNTPIGITGISLGGTVAEHWNLHLNPEKMPVLALSPVTLDKFMGIGDRITVAAAIAGSDAAAARLTDTPMSLGRVMTTNPLSKYHEPFMQALRVPAGLWRDDLMMNLDIVIHPNGGKGPLDVALAGADAVNHNGIAKIVSRIAGANASIVKGAAHDLGQEVTQPQAIKAIEQFFVRHFHI